MHPSITMSPLPNTFQMFFDHVQALCCYANKGFESKGIPIRLDSETVRRQLYTGALAGAAHAYATRNEDDGVLHENQLSVLVDVVEQFYMRRQNHGLIIGPMQIGKTTTSFALHWLGPIVFMLWQERMYPFHLLTNQTSHHDQTQHELSLFLGYYGDLPIVCCDKEKSASLNQYIRDNSLDPTFVYTPTLNMYRQIYLRRNQLHDALTARIVHRRVHGDSVQSIADTCRQATKLGLQPLILLDEPQWGAKGSQLRDTVLGQIFNAIQVAIGQEFSFRFIGISATPFELVGLSALWKVKMSLSPTYSGFNFFNGEPIDPHIDITPPAVFEFASYGRNHNLSDMTKINLQAWTKGEHDRCCVPHLRELIYHIAGLPTPHLANGPRGICIRAKTNNRETIRLINELDLDERIEVISYYGEDNKGLSVKRAIEAREKKDKPYIIFVTNKARLGDAFPRQVDYFLDFTHQAADLNALLQGLLGRACGHFKQSTVLMSEGNERLLRSLINAQGLPVYRPSRASVALRQPPREKANQMLVIDFHKAMLSTDPRLAALHRELENYFNQHLLIGHQTKTLNGAMKRDSSGRLIPLAHWLEEFGIYEMLNQHPERWFPRAIGAIHPILPNQQIDSPKSKWSDGYSKFVVDADGNCAVSVRQFSAITRGGFLGRGRSHRDGAAAQERTYGLIEPAIGMRKISEDGTPIFDDGMPGFWQVSAIALPLHSGVVQDPGHSAVNSDVHTLPDKYCVYEPLMTPAEMEIRDNHRA